MDQPTFFFQNRVACQNLTKGGVRTNWKGKKKGVLSKKKKDRRKGAEDTRPKKRR